MLEASSGPKPSEQHLHTRSSCIFCLCVCILQRDYYYQYTECDGTGSRWRVAIPLSPGSCSDLPPPTRGTDCCESNQRASSCFHVCVHINITLCVGLFPAFSCSAGMFLEMSTQLCTPCAAGSYSLGSGLRFDQWDAIPAGFTSLASFLDPGPNGDDIQACNRWRRLHQGVVTQNGLYDHSVFLLLQLVVDTAGRVPGVEPRRVHGVSNLRCPPGEAGICLLHLPVSRQQHFL